MTEETLEVWKRYLEAGVALKDLYRAPDDHIGIELEFVSHLTKEILDHGERGTHKKVLDLKKIRNEFLREHVALWAPMFVSRVLEFGQEPFFQGAALLFREFRESVSQSNSG